MCHILPRGWRIAAASIVAGGTRDHYMIDLDGKYPMYGFARNKGYGTPEHIAALKRYGPCPEHHRSPIARNGQSARIRYEDFSDRPLPTMLRQSRTLNLPTKEVNPMPYNRSVGAQGERDAADFLTGRGARILGMNFRCSQGEIDVIALMDGYLVFCEVKRRSSTRHGRPAEAVTQAKRRKVIRAAEVWLARNPQPDRPIRFDVLEILPGTFCHIPGAFDASR